MLKICSLSIPTVVCPHENVDNCIKGLFNEIDDGDGDGNVDG